MTRLANIEKVGYFPLPPSVTKLLLSAITAPHGGRILDPCAGEGTALVTLAQGLGLDPFGVELHDGRAQVVRQQVRALLAKRRSESGAPVKTRVLADSYLNLKTSRDGYNLLYLNPPYDYDREDGGDRGSRLEYQFLWRTRPHLQAGGLLVYVVPQHILKIRKLARYLISHFRDIRVYRFPDDTYERFKQIVLFGVRKGKAAPPDPEAVDALRRLALGETPLLLREKLASLPAAVDPFYTLPPLVVQDGQFKFRSQFVDPADALAEARQTGAAAGRNAVSGAARTIVLCLPHLVDKWQREFKAVWPGVRTMHLQTISDVDQFFAGQPDNAPLVGVLKQTTARSASGWEHAYDYGSPASHNYGSKGYSNIERPWGQVLSARKLMDLPAEKRPFTEHQIHALQQRGIRCPVCGATQFRSGRPLTVNELKTATRVCSNEKCRSPLYQFIRRRGSGASSTRSQIRGSFKLYTERERIIRGYTDKGQPVPFHELQKHVLSGAEGWHGSAVRDTFGYGKVPLAGYIKKRARRQPAGRRLDLLLVDEVHQYKGIDSDQGYAMHHLAQAAEKVVALTGTIYGGKAFSLFCLLFRLSPEMGRAYVDLEATGQRRLRSRDWVSSYGLLQRVETVTVGEDGKQTANSRSNVRYKELPGGSPAMLPWLLNRSVFLSLGDMGFPLPEYAEIPLSVPMAPEQAVLYEDLKELLKEELKERLIRGDKSLLAGYLYALLFWPDSPRRAKVVRCPRSGNVVASVPGLPDDFVGPKEEEIIELCLQEKAQGRRVLLLCQQTASLDITPQWRRMLEEQGLKVAVLKSSVSTGRREEWVQTQVDKGVDVLITHPRCVQTGLDLLHFPTIVWMAIDYSCA